MAKSIRFPPKPVAQQNKSDLRPLMEAHRAAGFDERIKPGS
jgi:hypothetical protein